ncbi:MULTISPECIES: hypothetical protein [Pseudomonas]|uniref:Uncharacterized protein n=1 Tax=Pseudomonas plecoglossicida TaxID=70775 RepID=A0ABX4U600_PSEDL|nr:MULTISPECIES: hypothetical protein [Pseudomonas]PLU85054.1 hypothetical protein CXG44_23160 [Pseudomonas plecoglossicida]PLU90896.1 hypothetical protein CXG45_21790 [Pseudomonas plecoglossicida]PLV01431.1 hypothetical protein CXG48_20280 [Pseudomonas plecoglossicida]PLV16582.1 hypothetical protein CXG47_00045 [Pseudomonas plecoglossicida]
MNSNISTAPATQIFQRQIRCWRESDSHKHWDCAIKGVGEGGVRLEFDSNGLEFGSAVAYELAFYLAEAIAIVEQPNAELTTAVVREDEPLLQRKYRLFVDWHLNATGEIPFSKASPELMPFPEGYAEVSIKTVRPGGVEMEFECSGYSFSKEDAAWIMEKLLEASGQTLEMYERHCLFETLKRQGHKIRG